MREYDYAPRPWDHVQNHDAVGQSFGLPRSTCWIARLAALIHARSIASCSAGAEGTLAPCWLCSSSGSRVISSVEARRATAILRVD